MIHLMERHRNVVPFLLYIKQEQKHRLEYMRSCCRFSFKDDVSKFIKYQFYLLSHFLDKEMLEMQREICSKSKAYDADACSQPLRQAHKDNTSHPFVSSD